MQIDPQLGSDLLRAYAHSTFQGGFFSGIARAMVHFRPAVESDRVFPPVTIHRLNCKWSHPAFSDRFNPNEEWNRAMVTTPGVSNFAAGRAERTSSSRSPRFRAAPSARRKLLCGRALACPGQYGYLHPELKDIANLVNERNETNQDAVLHHRLRHSSALVQ